MITNKRICKIEIKETDKGDLLSITRDESVSAEELEDWKIRIDGFLDYIVAEMKKEDSAE